MIVWAVVAGASFRELMVSLAVTVAPCGLRLQTLELGIEHCSLKFAQAIISGNHVMFIPDSITNSSAIMNGTACLSQRLVVGGNDAAFTRR